MAYVLLAALVLFARLVAPSMAAPKLDPAIQFALQTICHADASDDRGEPDQPEHADCLLCPACHLVAQASLPAPPPLPMPVALDVSIGLGAPPPPATGPPHVVRAATPPTGPPTLSV